MTLALTARQAMILPIAVFAWQVIGAARAFKPVEGERFSALAEIISVGFVALVVNDGSEPVNLGNDGEFTVLALADLVRRMVEGAGPLVREPLPVDDPTQRRPDLTVARATLDWSPQVPLEEGLRRTIEDFRARRSRAAPEVSWT
jgi:hypothetical protein